MKIMFDANILLDVFQYRQPHYTLSAACINKVLHGSVDGCVPAYVLSTFYYILRKHRDADMARDTVAWLLQRFNVAPCDHDVLARAHRSGIPDFEDAVVAASAEQAECMYILTRNLDDFAHSPVPAVSPSGLLEALVP